MQNKLKTLIELLGQLAEKYQMSEEDVNIVLSFCKELIDMEDEEFSYDDSQLELELEEEMANEDQQAE